MCTSSPRTAGVPEAGGVEASTFDAIILAGGGGRRMGGVSKADITVFGERLLDIALRAAEGAASTVVVGDVTAPPEVIVTLESPAGTGPAAGLLAGLEAVARPSSWTLVLACDLPDAAAAVSELHTARAAVDATTQGVCMRDDAGKPQPLLAVYRTDALHSAFTALGDPANRPLRAITDRLLVRQVTPRTARVDDLDTPAQLARWLDNTRPSAGVTTGIDMHSPRPEEH